MRLLGKELVLDGDPMHNLATFVTTCMEPEAQRIIAENLHRNFIDAEVEVAGADGGDRRLTEPTARREGRRGAPAAWASTRRQLGCNRRYDKPL
jgi:hypothetical protein